MTKLEDRSADEMADVIADLKRQLADVDAKLAAVAEERSGHALNVMTGDRAAKAACAGLDHQEGELQRRAATIRQAIVEATALEEAAVRRERVAEKERQAAEVEAAKAEMIDLADELDIDLRNIAKKFERLSNRGDYIVRCAWLATDGLREVQRNAFEPGSAVIWWGFRAAGLSRFLPQVAMGPGANSLGAQARHILRPESRPKRPPARPEHPEPLKSELLAITAAGGDREGFLREHAKDRPPPVRRKALA